MPWIETSTTGNTEVYNNFVISMVMHGNGKDESKHNTKN
jgi:hypothetical protein